MQALRNMLPLVVLIGMTRAHAEDESPADATLSEHVRTALTKLDDPDFLQREAAVDDLFTLRIGAIFPLRDAALNGSPEVSVRAFDVLQRLYRDEDEQTFEAVEQTFEILAKVDNLAVAARAERAFENGSDTRQERAIAKFEDLGGIINFAERRVDHAPLGRPRVENIMLPRGWKGGDAGLQLLSRIDDLKNSRTDLYIIRGVEISKEAQSDLLAEMPFMNIQMRGPARLGIRSRPDQRDLGCFINDVDPDSAADVAGLRGGDQVLEIDGQKVDNFDSLIRIIEKKEPGDRVPVVFRRGGEKQETVAELSPWKSPKSAKQKDQKPEKPRFSESAPLKSPNPTNSKP